MFSVVRAKCKLFYYNVSKAIHTFCL